MMASKDYRLTNEIINLYKLIIWQVFTLLQTWCDKVCQWLTTGGWFSPDTPVSSTKKADLYDIAEILLKVA